MPDGVALPGTESEVAALLQSAADTGVVVVPWGAGTKQDLGHPLERAGLVLSVEQLNSVVDYVPADMTITVGAGMRFSALQALTAQNGQTVPLDPPRADRATIGGIVATGSCGPRRGAYGGVRDLVLGVRVALADGRVVKAGGKVVKNVAGYDLTRLVAGSLGTLGVITEVSLRLRPLPADSRTLLFPFPGADAALNAAEQVLKSELLPAALTVLSPQAARRLNAPGEWPLAVALEESAGNNDYQADRLTRMFGGSSGAGASFWNDLTNYGDRFGARCRYRLSTVIGDLAGRVKAAGSLESIVYVAGGTVMLYGFDGEAMDDAVLESGPLSMRRNGNVWGPPRPEWKLAEKIKRALDPGHILNRGRFVGGI